MLYRIIRALVGLALGGFYRLEVLRRTEGLEAGPVMFVGNHPNSLMDPALVFVITPRPVTFLAREPLFRAPVLGALLKGLQALPVYRKQDHPGLMEKNEGTLEAAAGALVAGKAITLFPEGKSHSDPQLSDIKTGCARIALRAVRGGAPLRIVPVGLTYAQKHRFRSRVQVEVGTPIVVPAPPEGSRSGDASEVAWVRALTRQVADGMREVTLNLEQWADLKVVETAAQLYSLRLGEKNDSERVKRFARGMEILRRERPEQLEELREDVMSFRHRLDVAAAAPGDLPLLYRRPEVARFIGRNLASVLLGFPLFLIGLQLFVVPFMIVRLLSRAVPLSRDRVATFKFVASLVMVPLWQLLLSAVAYGALGLRGLWLSVLLAAPLALFTRYFYERRRSAARDAMVFLRLGNRARLKASLLAEGERLSDAIEELAAQLKPRVMKDAALPPEDPERERP